MRPILFLAAAMVATPITLRSQEHVHQPGMTHDQQAETSQAGQAAFAAISEVVALLMADSTTDWSKVNIEALRQHLVDMDNVTLRSVVRTEPVAGGARFIVTGEGRTVDAIRRMASAHAGTLEAPLKAVFEERPGGGALTVTSSERGGEARIRGLGFIGLLTVGAHHGAHHVAIARGQMPPGHTHK
jgi:hypothetical protein